MMAKDHADCQSLELSATKQRLLEQRLRGALSPRADSDSMTITPLPRKGPAVLSFAQQRLWFLDQLQPHSPMYNMTTAARLSGPLDAAALEQAIAAVIARHQILRTQFIVVEGEPRQQISEAAPTLLPLVDLSGLPADQRAAELQRRLEELARRPFDLRCDPLLRAELFQLGPVEHVLFLNMHHIASDAWSFGVFFREVSRLYEGFVTGRAMVLPDLPIQYADYAVWQRAAVNRDLMQGQLAYWKQQLAGAPELLELPTDRPRPVVQTFRGHRRVRLLPGTLKNDLQRLSPREGVTLFMMLLAAFQTLLHRLSSQEDILVGVPIAGRNQVETEGLIGFFINTLALRSRFSGNPTFRELLARVRQTTLEAFTHQELPFDKVVEELGPDRTASYAPLVQAMFVLQSAPVEGFELRHVRVKLEEVETGTAKFDLTLAITPMADGLEAQIEYNQDLFDAATIDRWLGHFERLLEGIVADPERRISQLPLLAEAERRRLLVEWNQTRTDYPREASVAQLFEAMAAQCPEAVAVVAGAEQLTYAELNQRANRLAHHLQNLGIQPEQKVGVYLERSPALVVALLAILKTGSAYLPLDRAYPKERLAFMLRDAQVPLVITEQRWAPDLPGPAASLLCLDAAGPQLAGECAANPGVRIPGTHLAYVIYTSGSTGKPKGVCVPHRAISRLVLNTDYVRLEPSDVMAQVSNCSFDAATWEIWGPLLNGARLVMLPTEIVLSPGDFAAQLEQHGVTALFLTTALFNQFAAEKPEAFGGLRHLLFGGEAVEPKWVAAVLSRRPPQRLLHVYGPTETTTFASWHLVEQVPENSHTIPIGRPIANTTLYVLDGLLQPVPIGVPGELYVGGDGLATGYLKRPELTAQRFIPDPFSADPAAHLYKTGDLVRRRPDGAIEYLGRLDEQVKIRGFRVELGEVEATLAQHPGVRQCVVVARADAAGAKQLVGYVVPAQPSAAEPGEWQNFLRQQLPEYMVPAWMVPLPELPLSPNGKIDRRALPDPEFNPPISADHPAPRDQVERQLEQLWEQVLGLRGIGIHDKFFALGGHSLLAVQLLAQVEQTFGRKLSITALLQNPTIAQMAGLLRRTQAPESHSLLVEIQPRGFKPPLVLVHGVGGGMFWGYHNLARHLGLDQPIFAIKSRGLDGQPEFDRIEAMAEAYLADLQRIQPHGPYYLGGYCFGGLVAYEMARRLRAQGERVALLALINSGPPNSSYTRIRWTPLFAIKFAKNLGLWLANSLRWTPAQRRGFFRWKARLFKQRLQRLWLPSPPAGQTTPDIETLIDLSQYPEDQRELWSTHVEALLKYHPQTYPGEVTLFRSPVHQLVCSYDPQYGWGDLALGGVTVKVVPGAHERIIEEPNVRVLAAALKTCLDAAQAGTGRVSARPLDTRPPPASERRCWGLPRLRPRRGILLLALLMTTAALLYGCSILSSNRGTRLAFRGWAENRFEIPALGAVAAAGARPGRSRRKGLPITRQPRTEPLPLSLAQQRLWFLEQFQPQSIWYNRSQAVRLTGRLDASALERSLQEIARRHETLRTRFLMLANQPAQLIVPAPAATLSQVDLRGLSGQARDSELQRQFLAQAQQPFDLAGDSLMRAALVRLEEETQFLFVTFHQIIADAWSMGLFLNELAALYGQFVSGRHAALPELEIQYADYSVWQHRAVDAEELAELLAYWKNQLAGAPALLEWPADRPRPAWESHRGARHALQVAPDLTAALKALGEAENGTLFTALLGAFQALAARYTGREDIVAGSMVVNRNRIEIEPLIGLFANTLVLRTDLSGDPAVREILKRATAVTLDAEAHQDLPFETLVEALQPARDTSHHPLFQTMLLLHPPLPSLNAAGLQFTPVDLDPGLAQFDLTLELTETSAGLEGWIEYASDLFDPSSIARLANHFQNLLASMVAKPDLRLSELPMLSEAEQRQLLVEWNDTRRVFPADRCAHQLFEAQVERTPQAVALVCGQQRLSYAELNARADGIAGRLRALGVGPETLVGLCLERSPDLVAAMLGILKAGGAYVPMDPAYPKDRLQFMLQDARAPVLVTQQRLAPALAVPGVQALLLDEPDAAPALASAPAQGRVVPENLAYVLYTSGSTGRPKGVAIEHRSVTNFIFWAQEIFTRDELAGVLASTSVCFDLSVFESFAPLSCGGKMILAEDALQLAQLPAAGEVTLINTVPSAMAELLRMHAVPASVQVVNLAGEPLSRQMADQVYAASVRKVYDLYGPTEDTVYSTFALRQPGGPATIGRPMANKQAYILRPQQQLLPVGAAGELYLGGAGLARGYLHQPELTKQKFLPDRLSRHPGGRLYRTGDLARYRPDGTIEFLGRMDHQVKIRGFRIELGEIEENLRRHPEVREAVVVARAESAGDKRLVAYVVPGPSPAPTVAQLLDFLKERLPDYMLPNLFITVEALPRTPSGKVDRNALPAPDQARTDLGTAFEPPHTEVQQLLAQIWRDVLNVPRVGVHDQFFALGGHSLMVTQVISRVRDALAVDLPMRVVFENPTIAQFSEVIEHRLLEEVQALSEEEAQQLNATVAAEITAPELQQSA